MDVKYLRNGVKHYAYHNLYEYCRPCDNSLTKKIVLSFLNFSLSVLRRTLNHFSLVSDGQYMFHGTAIETLRTVYIIRE